MFTKRFILLSLGVFLIFNSNHLFAQWGPKGDTTLCAREYSIFKENMKTKAYDFAFPSFRFLMQNCPSVHPNLYIYGEQLLKNQIEKAENEAVKQKYVDSLLMLYDQRLSIAQNNSKYGNEGFIIGKKIQDLSTYRADSVQLLYNLSKGQVDKFKGNTLASVMSFYMFYTDKLKDAGKFNCEDVIDIYNLLSGYIDENLNKYEEKDTTKYKNYVTAQDNIDKVAGPCLTCETLVDIYDKNYEANKDNCSWIKKAASVLDRKKCIKDHKDKVTLQNIFIKNFECDPHVDAAMKLGAMFVLLENNDKAAEYFEKAADLSTDDHEKAKIYMLLASVQAQMGQYSQARSSALKAAGFRKNWGKPYIFIGDLYAGSMGRCQSDNGCESRAVFWAAVDKYSYAKSIDPSFTDEANRKIGISAANYPTKEDCFFLNMSSGQSYKVGCWIQESTTIRTK